MELIQISALLIAQAEKLSVSLPSLRWHLFGSILWASRPNDIDLLVIYEQLIEPKLVREALREISLTLPLDILFMTEKEVIETQFLSQWPTLQLFPIQ
ncbi:MAG: hypothetical protein ABL984_15595 [Pyrinomonadaceae bacterium]